MDEQHNPPAKRSVLDTLSPVQIFIFGIVEGVLVLCTIGFFIMLGLYFNKGGISKSVTGAAQPTENVGIPSAESPKLVDIAGQVGLDVGDFTSCVKDKKFASAVQEDEAEAQKVGGRGTPYSIVIGPKGETYPVNGAQPFEIVDALIKKLLGQTYDSELEQYIPKAQTGLTLRQADSKNEPVRGNLNAKITVVEYSDFECPYCKRFHETMLQVMDVHQENIRWVYRHFPLDSLHQNARTEALAAECANEQGKFWEFTDTVFAVTPSNDGIDITI